MKNQRNHARYRWERRCLASGRAVAFFLSLVSLMIVASLLLGPSRGASAPAVALSRTSQADTAAAVVALQKSIDSGAFFEMSGAKQTALLMRAGMRYEAGVLKKNEYVPRPAFDTAAVRSDRDSPLSGLANPQVNNPALDLTEEKTQSETTVSLAGGTNLVAAYNDSGSLLGGVQSFTGYSTSTDMGATWRDMGSPPVSTVDTFGDPVLARDNLSGRMYLATLAGNTNGINVYNSTDNGITWNGPVNGAPGTDAADGDKAWITVDNAAGAGQGNVYHAYRDFAFGNGVRFTRSTDQGATFTPSPGLLIKAEGSFNVQGANVTAGADHAVYVGWLDQSEGSDTPNIIKVRKSTDLGVTFAPEVTVTTLNSTDINGDLGIPAGYRSSAFPQFVANPVNANIIYAVHNDVNTAGTDRGDIYFQQSNDGGATWSVRTKVNTDATTNVQAFPTIAVRPNGSGLCVMWYDNRSDPANTKFERFARMATISGTTVTFGLNFVISNSQSTPIFGRDPVVVDTYLGDYDQATADNSNFYDTFLDTRLGDQDVRFARISMAGPGPVLHAPMPVVSGGNGNSTLEIDECADLVVTVRNDGTAAATSVTETLTTTTPGVVILNGTQLQPDIPTGGAGANLAPFHVSVAPGFTCGNSIAFTLTISYAGGSDTLNFSVPTTGTGYSFTTVTGQAIVPGATDIGNHDDDVVTSIVLPFPFSFYGTSFTTANLSSNGNLQFTSSNAEYFNACLPTVSMNNLIASLWDDVRTDNGTDGIFTSVSGASPNRIFNIEWRATYYDTGAPVNFEIRLYETTGQVDFIYGTLNGAGASATVGLQKGTGAGGPNDVTQFSCKTASLSGGLKITWTFNDRCSTGGGTCGRNQIDQAQFFVRQQYLDFLNREPDPVGLAFWTNEITSCGAGQQCIEAKRINVSAAFFLSIEFQQTGYLVYRFYKAAYGNLPGAPVPLRFSEFVPDTQEIAQGVVVNQPGWEQVLENNKQAFAAEFVQRSRFTSVYPTSLTPDQFVDQLFTNAGVSPSATDRAAAINEFGSATTTVDMAARARALRRVAENSRLAQQEFNRAFVLMQYFGYLRRNPNDPPEPTLDFQGYNFWLNKLNQFNGSFQEAEMVKAFLVSAEYRQRFGQQ